LEIKERGIKGVFEITLSPHKDSRGFFMRTYDIQLFKELGIDREWVQENHSRSEEKGIIRGLHFQLHPFSETKLVRCITGAVLDVYVDLRKDSRTFGQWGSIELSCDNKKMIMIPRGFAHGFCTLTETSEVLYKVDNFYSKKHECGIIWNDPQLNIRWPVRNPILSDKDKMNYTFSSFVEKYNYIDD
jgi:dTDP-4-dehydrorhamnose 3,5-epimerase